MATGTAGTTARTLAFQAVHYLRKTVNYNDALIGGSLAGSPFGAYLPAGASILFTKVLVKTAFSGGSAYVLTVGQNSTSYNDIINSSNAVDLTATGASIVFKGADLDLSSADALPYLKIANSGTGAAGVVEVTIVYTINNDQ